MTGPLAREAVEMCAFLPRILKSLSSASGFTETPICKAELAVEQLSDCSRDC